MRMRVVNEIIQTLGFGISFLIFLMTFLLDSKEREETKTEGVDLKIQPLHPNSNGKRRRHPTSSYVTLT